YFIIPFPKKQVKNLSFCKPDRVTPCSFSVLVRTFYPNISLMTLQFVFSVLNRIVIRSAHSGNTVIYIIYSNKVNPVDRTAVNVGHTVSDSPVTDLRSR